MNGPSPSRLVAALALLGGAFILLVTGVLAIPMAAYLIGRDLVPATAVDHRTVAALVPAVPVLVGVAALQVAAAIGLIAERRWAAPLAVAVGIGWAAAWTFSLVATVAGWAPFDVSMRPDRVAAMSAGVSMSVIGILASVAVVGLVTLDRAFDRVARPDPSR